MVDWLLRIVIGRCFLPVVIGNYYGYANIIVVVAAALFPNIGNLIEVCFGPGMLIFFEILNYP